MAYAASMHDADIYVKTDAGRDEIRSRDRGLPMAIRAILLMIDGQRSVAAMRAIIAGSKAPPDVLDSLIAQGLIEPVAGSTVAPTAPTSIAVPRMAAPASIATPRMAEPARPRPIEAATPSTSRFSYDGPLDLTLPTIAGPSIVAGTPVAPAPADLPASQGSAPIDRYEHLYGMMNEIVRDFLSPTRRYFFQLKIERCGTPEELLELLHDLQTVLAKARGEAFASEVIARLRSAAS